MTTTTPPLSAHQLRLHVEDATPIAPPSVDAGWLSELRRNFAEATGWNLDWGVRRSTARGHRRVDVPEPPPLGSLSLALPAPHFAGNESPPPSEPPMPLAHQPPRAALQPLVQSLNLLLEQLESARRALRHREAELATAIPIGARPESGRAVARRLEELLRTTAELTHARAAALYLLDDATSVLKMRAAWGIPANRYWEEPRPLRGQLADLEALLGRTVTLNDLEPTTSWRPPEPCNAAICTLVGSQAMPLGTLWLFADAPTAFTRDQAALVELTAGRVAVELEREVLFREARQTELVRRQWQHAAMWQRHRQPPVEPLGDGWQIAGGSDVGSRLATEFCDWELLPTGRLGVSVGRADGNNLEGSLTIAALHGSFKSISPLCRDPRQLMARLNESVWRSSAGDATSSLTYVTIDTETGAADVSVTGAVGGMIVRPDEVTRLRPTKKHLGQAPDTKFALSQAQLNVGDLLILCSGRLRTESGATDQFPLTLDAVTRIVRAQPQTASAAAVADALQAALNELDALDHPSPSLVVVRRLPTP